MISCEKEIDFPYADAPSDMIVVEALICNTNKYHSLRITQPRANPNHAEIAVSGAKVTVAVEDNIYDLLEDTTEVGLYVSSHPFSGLPGTPVSMRIDLNGQVYTATDVMPHIPFMARLFFTPIHDEPDWYYASPPLHLHTAGGQAMWVVEADWSFLPDFDDAPEDSCRARLFFFNLHNIDVGQIFAAEKEKVRIRKGARIIQNKYALSTEHACFWRSILLETEWRGGLFDVSQGETYSNIKPDAAGFFGASAVVRDTFYLQP